METRRAWQLVAGLGLMLAVAAPARSQVGGPLPLALGDPAADLVYSPVVPCRIVDTRPAGGPIAGGAQRSFVVAGTTGFEVQGGNPGGCAIPDGAAAVVVNFVAVGPAGPGNLRAWPFGGPTPNASIINYASLPGLNVANGGAVPLCAPVPGPCPSDLTVQADVSATDLVADVLGFFRPFADGAILTDTQALELRVAGQRALRLEGGGTGGFYGSGPNLVGGAFINTASGSSATVGGGRNNTASGDFATVPGGREASASLFGQMAYASGRFATDGDAQTSLFVLRRFTTNATPTELFLDDVGARIILVVGRTMTFDILITARTTGAFPAKSAGYHVLGVIENDAGFVTFVGGVPGVATLGEDDAAWDVSVLADQTNGALGIRVTGAASTPIRWVAVVRTVEVTQ